MGLFDEIKSKWIIKQGKYAIFWGNFTFPQKHLKSAQLTNPSVVQQQTAWICYVNRLFYLIHFLLEHAVFSLSSFTLFRFFILDETGERKVFYALYCINFSETHAGAGKMVKMMEVLNWYWNESFNKCDIFAMELTTPKKNDVESRWRRKDGRSFLLFHQS